MTCNRIGFILPSSVSHPIPSTRVSVLNMLPYLEEAGYSAEIAFEPAIATATPDLSGLCPDDLASRFDIIYFQKVHGPSVESLARSLRARGVRTIYGVCDLFDAAMSEAVDVIAVVTDYLKASYPEELRGKTRVVHDGVEKPEFCKTDWGNRRASTAHPLEAVLVTSHPLDRLPVIIAPPRWVRVTIVGHYPEQETAWGKLRAFLSNIRARTDWKERWRFLRFVLHPHIRLHHWTPEGVYQELMAADIGIIPIEPSNRIAYGLDVEDWLIKSENRMTLMMAAGLPVIATPIPAYEAVLTKGGGAVLARNKKEWMAALEELRDPDLRRSRGELARRTALKSYSLEAQARELMQLLAELCPGQDLSITEPSLGRSN